MPEMQQYEHGVPSWVDLSTSDIPKAQEFYRALFGWTAQDMGEEAGHYTILFKDGKMVSALTPAQNPGPPFWTTYVNVDDADAIAANVTGAGGQVVFGPMDVMTQGRMVVFMDPTGAACAAWQPGDHRGAQLVNEPGAVVWNELTTSDLAGARQFYSRVFGWTWGGSDDYAEFQVSGRTVGGVMPRPAELPAEVPDHWLVYFAVADVDAEAERARELGATVVFGPADIPGTGRFASLLDPQGAAFAIFAGS